MSEVFARLEEDSGPTEAQEETVVDFKFDKKGFADLEKQIGQQLKAAKAEANRPPMGIS